METSVTSVVSRTLMRCLLTHLVKVFFCTLSRSSKEHREKKEVNDMFELHTPPQRLELYYLCQVVRKKKSLLTESLTESKCFPCTLKMLGFSIFIRIPQFHQLIHYFLNTKKTQNNNSKMTWAVTPSVLTCVTTPCSAR